MRVPLYKLAGHLQGSLAPIYVITGDEPLQQREATDWIRSAARQQGFASRQVFEVETGFDWTQLTASTQSLSLFSEKKIIDLRLPGGKPGTQGSKWLAEYADMPAGDTLLLLTLPKVPLTSKWIKALDKSGVLVQIWPIDEHKLPAWIGQRMQAAGLQPQAGVAEELARRTEGNLLAAQQEIEKLSLLFGTTPISLEQLQQSIEDSARYDVYTLVDAALAGRAKRVEHIIAGLQGEGVAAPVVLWALAREIRALSEMSRQLAAGMPMNVVMQQAKVWKNRQALVAAALKRLKLARCLDLLQACHHADRAIKGASQEQPWLLLEQISLALAGIGIDWQYCAPT